MFLGIAFTAVVVLALWCGRENGKDHEGEFDVRVGRATIHTRQDVRFIAGLLAAILLILGAIADALMAR